MITGACLCGAVRYEVDGPISQLTHCHCSMCRKQHGAAFASFADAPASGFRWLSDEAELRTFASSPGVLRRSCKTCGSVAPVAFGEIVGLPAGNLVGDLGAPQARHVHVASKAPFHQITGGVVQYAGPPPDWTPEVARTVAPVLAGRTHGSCLCGSVTFAVSGSPGRFLQCHCSRCRRARSAAHGCNGFYPLAQFSWLSGRELVQTYRPPDAARFLAAFCKQCGGGAPGERDGVPFVLVPMGLLDGDPGCGPQAHIHVASKSSWYPITDDLPQFAELPS